MSVGCMGGCSGYVSKKPTEWAGWWCNLK